MKKGISHYMKNKIVLFGAIIVVIIVVALIAFRSSGKSYETAVAERVNVAEQVAVTGKVTAIQKAELGLENGGVVNKINYKVGDTVKAGDVIVSLDSADDYAQLAAERANLAELTNGLRVEEQSVEESKLVTAQVSLEDAKTGVITALHDSYIKTEGAIVNYADSLFMNPQSVGPQLNVRTDSYNQKLAIETKRVEVTDKLKMWKSDLDSLNLSTTTDPTPYLDRVKGAVETIKSFLSSLSVIVSALSTGNSGLTQSQIDAYNLSINNALTNFTAGVSSLASADANYRNSISNLDLTKNQYTLKKAGSSAETIEAQSAKVTQAQAALSKKRITSPIDGIVTRIDPQLGEFVSAGVSVVTVMTDGFKVEVNIPETDIAKISLQNKAIITLDAYDESVTFNAHVMAIDPAETIVEGVPTYKVTLQFDDKDSRIRSGMTANINIVTQDKEGVVAVPYRAVLEKNGQKYVRVVTGDTYKEVQVQTGIRGNDGKIEIISGIDAGTNIVTFVK